MLSALLRAHGKSASAARVRAALPFVEDSWLDEVLVCPDGSLVDVTATLAKIALDQ